MKSLRKFNRSAVITGLAMLFLGTNILFRGTIWNVVLGDERYFVGGLALLAGLYFVFLGFKTPK